MEKRRLEVASGGRSVTIAFYPGTAPEALAKTVRDALGLSEGASLTLRDSDGDVVALSDALPDGLKLTLEGPSPGPASGSAGEAPGPRPYPIVGNLPEFTRKGGYLANMRRLLAEHGDFVRLRIRGAPVFLCANADVVRDLGARPAVFQKIVTRTTSPVANLRQTVGDALFTGNDTEENWQIAHRMLMPEFGAQAIKTMFPRLSGTADKLCDRLLALGPGEPFDVPEMMTRMAFETIAYCGFDTSFGSLESKELPPFLAAMTETLNDAMGAASQILPSAFHPIARGRRQRSDRVLHETVDGILQERRRQVEQGKPVADDLMQAMLAGSDPQTGKSLSDENIRNQLITFLVAGHETTSAALAYALHYLASNPACEARLIDEIDRVLGRDYSYRPSHADVERLEYAGRVVKETLRLRPTLPAFFKLALENTVVSGNFAIPKNSRIIIVLPSLHTNPAYWGADAERFDPDRFLPAAVAPRHPDCYHPFGMGARSCIGFQFALVEAKLVLARFYQRFRARHADPGYVLRDVDTLTLKPDALSMVLEHRPEERGKLPSRQERPVEPQAAAEASGTPLTILFGSVTGASQELAMRLAQRARAAGYPAVVADLDSRTAQLAASPGPVVIVTSTYNGEPPDNARRFAAWLATPGQAASSLAGVRYAVLGLGNRQWRSTFQKFPRWIDERLAQLGARRLVGVGAVDADGDSDRDAEAWTAAAWPEMTRELGKASSGARAAAADPGPRAYRVEVANYAGADLKAIRPCCYPVHHEARTATILSRKELLPDGSERSTVHLEVSLPGGVSYRAGDHLGVFPENPFELVHAVAERCGLRALDVVILRSEGGDAGDDSTPVPLGVPLFVRDLLTHHVDLTGPVSRAELRALAERCPCPPERDALLLLSSEERFRTDVLEPRLTIVDVLQRYGSIPIELGQLVATRPVVKPRYYSISSSPRLLARACTITVGLHQFAGPGGDPREGLCSSYLAGVEAGSGLRIVVRDNGGGFRLPEDPAADLILVGAGTGLAPLRGFLQERQALLREGGKLGRSLLFFGCRRPDEDYLYREELEAYLADGTLTGLYPAFSREPGRPRAYVQDRLRERGDEVAALIKGGATVYVCGDAKRFAPDVRAAFAEVLRREGALDAAAADERLGTLKAQGRYLEDIWASS